MEHEKEPDYMWVTVNFIPAPPGWRILFKDEAVIFTHPLPGWLIQDRVTEKDPIDIRDRRVIAAQVEDWGELYPVDFNHDSFVGILGPGEDTIALEKVTPSKSAFELNVAREREITERAKQIGRA